MLKNNGEEGIKYEKVDIHHLNPKSITMGHDSASEHRDGVLVAPRRRAGGVAPSTRIAPGTRPRRLPETQN